MRSKKKYIGLIVIIIVMVGLVFLARHYDSSIHDHRTYKYTYNGFEWHTFTTCADTSLVTADNGSHLDYIPDAYKKFMKRKYRIDL